MEITLHGKNVAVLVDRGFEQVELTGPVDALNNAGADVKIISRLQMVKAWNHSDWGYEFRTDILIDQADPEDFDALLLPGGVMNPDRLRINIKAVNFVKHFMQKGKPVAAICHGPWVLIETGYLKGRRVTSYPSIKTDLINAGAEWFDQEVVVDHGLVTSRNPDDIPAFNKKMIEEIKEGKHEMVGV